MMKNGLTRIMVFFVFFIVAGTAAAEQIFYESFESPVIDGKVPGAPPGWVVGGLSAETNIGLEDAAVTGKTGDQYAYIYGAGDSMPNGTRYLQTTSSILASNLTAWIRYTLTCDVAVDRVNNVLLRVELLAGTNVIGSADRRLASAGTFSASGSEDLLDSRVEIQVFPSDTHPNLGEQLSIRLRRIDGEWNKDAMFDNIDLDAADTTSDFTPPTTNTPSWEGLPTPSVDNGIFMCATNLSDPNGVQYFFTNTVNGNTSGWIDEMYWTETGLTPGVTYSYKYKARDQSFNANETLWSSQESVICEADIILYQSFEAPKTDLSEWSGNWSSLNESGGEISTPYGMNVLNTGYNSPATAALTDVLVAAYTYTLSFAAGNHVPRTGVQYTVELMAGGVVVTNLVGMTSTDDMSVRNTLTFVPSVTTTNLGQTISLRFYHSDTGHDQWRSWALFDDISFKAVPPPPAGTVFMLK